MSKIASMQYAYLAHVSHFSDDIRIFSILFHLFFTEIVLVSAAIIIDSFHVCNAVVVFGLQNRVE